ncbi:RxLR effector protein, partial [Phytophthora megakarya]
MWFYRTTLVVTIITLVFCGTEATSNKISTPPNIPGRLRRLTPSIDSALPNVKDSDERGILSNLKTNLGDWSKTTYWAVLGKSDDYVKKKLGLQTLTGTALTNHPNYRLLTKFRYKIEGRMLGTWFEERLTLNGAWARLKLNQVDQTRVMQTDAYKTYMRYVQMYDDWIYH